MRDVWRRFRRLPAVTVVQAKSSDNSIAFLDGSSKRALSCAHVALQCSCTLCRTYASWWNSSDILYAHAQWHQSKTVCSHAERIDVTNKACRLRVVLPSISTGTTNCESKSHREPVSPAAPFVQVAVFKFHLSLNCLELIIFPRLRESCSPGVTVALFIADLCLTARKHCLVVR